MRKHKETVLSPETEVDIVMYRCVDYQNALRIKKEGEAKGWTVKIVQKNYLKQGNKI